MYFVICKNTKYHQPYWWVIKSDGNNATLATSEMCSTKSVCLNAINIVKGNASTAPTYDRTGE